MPTSVSQAWRARIESADGLEVLGTGFLVDPTSVVTCAHVVDGLDKVRISFLDAAQPVSVDAEVGFRGPWRDGDDRGDVAVVVLPRPVAIEPARLARSADLLLRPGDATPAVLHTHGYPASFPDGADTRVQAPYRALRRSEWLQLEADGASGILLRKGFSGAAVTRADTSEVVGMIIGAERSLSTGTGKMLPLRVIESYWSGIGDFLPLGDLPPGAGRELRRILDTAQVRGGPSEIYRASLPSGIGPAHEPFATLWDAARFTAEEINARSVDPRDSPLVRFCAVVMRRAVSSGTKTHLRHWLRHHCGVDDAFFLDPDDSPPATGLVAIRVVPSAEPQHCNLTVRGFAGHQGQSVYAGKVPVNQLRAMVELTLPKALRCIPESVAPENVMVQFELPRSLLDKPVDEWRDGPKSDRQIGWVFPVVVRDLVDDTDDTGRLTRARWKVLREQTTSGLHTVGCREVRTRRGLLAWLLKGGDRTILALSNPPRTPTARNAVAAGLESGIPVMLWTRTKCTDDHNHVGLCDGDRFLEQLEKALESAAPRELPERVRLLRASAYADGGELFRCKAVALFWRDPDLGRPEPIPLVLAE